MENSNNFEDLLNKIIPLRTRESLAKIECVSIRKNMVEEITLYTKNCLSHFLSVYTFGASHCLGEIVCLHPHNYIYENIMSLNIFDFLSIEIEKDVHLFLDFVNGSTILQFGQIDLTGNLRVIKPNFEISKEFIKNNNVKINAPSFFDNVAVNYIKLVF